MANSLKNQAIEARNKREREKAQEIYAERPYSEEYRPLKLLALSVQYASNALSFMTQGFGIWFLAFMWLSSLLYTQVAWYFAIALGLVGALLIELSKRVLSRYFFKSLFNVRVDVSPILGVGLCVVLAFSLGLSFFASLYLPNIVTEKPELADIKKLENEFDHQIADLANERNNYRKNRLYKNRLASDDAEVVLEYNKKIEKLQNEKASVLKNANTENKNLLGNWVTQNNANGTVLGWIMVLFEVLFLCSTAYLFYYAWNVSEDGPPTPSTPKRDKRERDLNTLTDSLTDNNDDELGETSTDNCQTNKTTVVDKNSIEDLEFVDVFDNDTIDRIKRLKDAIVKNHQRSFNSQTEEARQNNKEKAEERAAFLYKEYGIKCDFDKKGEKVYFSSLKTA